mgnify:FL=1
MLKIISHNLQETNFIGKIIGKNTEKGTVICLDGDLGAGKTTLTQSIAKGIEIDEYITSPTFNIIKEYDGRLKLFHMDVYRINDIIEMIDLGYEEYIYSDGVCIIEWSDKIKEILPENRINMRLLRGKEENERTFHIDGKGSSFEKIEKELMKYDSTSN